MRSADVAARDGDCDRVLALATSRLASMPTRRDSRDERRASAAWLALVVGGAASAAPRQADARARAPAHTRRREGRARPRRRPRSGRPPCRARDGALELAQRRPLRLADGLAGRLDRQVVLISARSSSCAAPGAAAGAHGRRRLRGRGSGACAVAARPSSFGGVREQRRSTTRRGCPLHEPPRDEPLPDRPEVRRHPVEDEAGRKVRDDEHEDERHEHEDDALRLLAVGAMKRPDAIWLAT